MIEKVWRAVLRRVVDALWVLSNALDRTVVRFGGRRWPWDYSPERLAERIWDRWSLWVK